MTYLNRTYNLEVGVLTVKIKAPELVENDDYCCTVVFGGEYKMLGLKKINHVGYGIDPLQATLNAIQFIQVNLKSFKKVLRFESELSSEIGIPYLISGHLCGDTEFRNYCRQLIAKRIEEFELAIKKP
jgi:hypothetical protein